MQRSVPIFKQSCSSHLCGEIAVPGSMYCEMHKCFPASIVSKTASEPYCESVNCSEKCAINSIYCLTHTCFPEEIVFNNDDSIIMDMFTDTKLIEEQKKIEEQIKHRRRNGADWSSDFTGLSNGTKPYTAPRVENNKFSIEDSKRQYTIYDKPRKKIIDIHKPNKKVIESLMPNTDIYGLKDINRKCIYTDCFASCLFMGKTCVRHSCLYCFESAIFTLNICEFHMPKELTRCVSESDLPDILQINIDCYLTKLSDKIIYIIMNYI